QLSTPALEYEEILLGKYGEEGDKLMYRFVDNGERKVALRYDQTVPLARVVAQYQNELPMPFKRYQIQPVWRAENTQKGRFREFMQCDADIVGIDTPLSDAETIVLAAKAVEKLGFLNYKIIINDRNIFSNLVKKELFSEKSIQTIIRAIDKLKKIGKEAVLDEMINKGIPVEQATYALQTIGEAKPTQRIEKILSLLNKFDIDNQKVEFNPTLARGLDYYTGLIFEIEIEGYSAGSVCGGGRYDNLVGMFAGRQIPAVGFAFGFDRLIEAMGELKIFPTEIEQSSTQVLVTIFNQELLNKSLEISSQLRSNYINTEIYLNENAQMEKQLKYANQKGIPYVVIIGPDEAEKNAVTIRNMETREQETLTQEELIDKLKISNS
ncbi:MAG: histidine--tRNA ligase, partial [Patescibacteria group bacterium]|nr:histidine--tRNA ligase [Patescibacteria group bacterium]